MAWTNVITPLRRGDADEVARQPRGVVARQRARGDPLDRSPRYPIRAMVGMALAKSLYALPTWTRTVRLVTEHAGLRSAIGCRSVAAVPSVDACYRFTRKLRQHKGMLDACIASVLASLHDNLPEFGEHVAIDGWDLLAYANG